MESKQLKFKGNQVGSVQYDTKTLIPEPNSVFILNIELKPEYRGKGIFSLLFKLLLLFFKLKKYQSVFLEPDITQGKEYANYLTGLYKHYGFKEYEKDSSLLMKKLT